MAEKTKLDLQITKVSGKKIETTDQKAHNIQLTRLGKKEGKKMEVLDFLSMRSHQSFEDKAEINPIEIKIENDKIFLFKKYKKTALGLDLKICCFQAQ